MKDLIIPVNNEALSRALIAIVGEENTKAIVEAYKVIDAAMVFGYQKGVAEGDEMRKMAAEEYVEALRSSADTQEAYDAGFNDGGQEGYDYGYVDGVSDARMWPSFADDQVAAICADDLFEDESWSDEQEAEYYEGDSGDENDFVKVNAHVEGESWYTKEEMDSAGIAYDDASHARAAAGVKERAAAVAAYYDNKTLLS